jgi:MOSC domain-containing protein YiiM
MKLVSVNVSLGRIARWQGRELPFGTFGENLTIEGFPEEEVCVGDRFRIGSAVLEAVQPRFPCFKLALKFSDERMVERFLESERWGVYFRVTAEGTLQAGDAVAREYRDPAGFPVPDVLRLMLSDKKSSEDLNRALAAEALPPDWRGKFSESLRRSEERP